MDGILITGQGLVRVSSKGFCFRSFASDSSACQGRLAGQMWIKSLIYAKSPICDPPQPTRVFVMVSHSQANHINQVH
jgi:hypothetical protein